MVYATPGREYLRGRLVLRVAWLWAEPGSAEEKGEVRWEAVRQDRSGRARVDLQYDKTRVS
jgi:hypothetical protein